MKIYLAGPLFTQAERIWNRHVADALRRLDPQLEIFLPQDEASAAIEGDAIDFQKIFDLSIRGILACKAVVAVLDGSDSDSGTSFECGVAFGLRKPVIGVRTDIRASEDRGLNAMLSQSSTALVYFSSLNEDIDELAAVVVLKLRESEQACPTRRT